ncbi:MAG TPA: hypothetical protein VHZ77_09515 [Gaiellaceae bacterium]|nr:hypothetical protein [Gaiellaceae bacterium]
MGGTPNERRFTVGVAARGGVRGGGTLIIGNGRLECQLGRGSRSISGVERVRHEGTTVDVYRARLIPFWCNVSVVIDDGEAAMLASKSAFGLRSLETALTEAGFQVRVHHTWTDRGLSSPEIVAGRKLNPS